MYLVTGGAGFIGNFVNYIQRVCDDEIVVIDSLSYASDINFIKKILRLHLYGVTLQMKNMSIISSNIQPKKYFILR